MKRTGDRVDQGTLGQLLRSEGAPMLLLVGAVLGCGKDGQPAKPEAAAVAKADAAEVVQGASQDAAPEPVAEAPVDPVVHAACADGAELREALLGEAMAACAKSVPAGWEDAVRDAARSKLSRFEEVVGAFDDEGRSACEAGCRAWMDGLASLQLPQCADDPTFSEISFEQLMQVRSATVAIQIAATGPAEFQAVTDALLSGAEGFLALARGSTPGLPFVLGADFAGAHDDWVEWVGASSPASTARRRALVAAAPSAAHRWELYEDEIRARGEEVESERFEGHRFVLMDMPAFTDDTFDTKVVPRELWEAVIAALLEVGCDDGWDACDEELQALEKSFTKDIDEGAMRTLFWSPGAYADLDAAGREALDAAMRARAMSFLVVGFASLEVSANAKLQAED